MELWLVKDSTMTNITPLVGRISWRSNVDELGDELTFNIAFNDDRYFPQNPVEIGDLIVFKVESEVFRGIVVSEQRSGRYSIEYTAFDYAFYLNKSKGVYQFNNVTAKNAISKLCNDFDIPIGAINIAPVVIEKIYVQKTISDIIKDIIEKVQNTTATSYLMEMRAGKLHIEEQSNLIVTGTFQLASNVAENDVTSAIGELTRTRSMEDMKNSIQIVQDNDVVVTIQNETLINTYGLLQEVITVDNSIAEAKNIASNMLKELGKIFEEANVTMIGDERVRAGRIIEIEEPITGMSGSYLVKSVSHSFENGIHKMSLGLEVT